MNTATRVFLMYRAGIRLPALPLAQRPGLRNLILMLAILATAFVVIYLKDANRRQFIHYQQLQQIHEKQYEVWGKLLIEQSTLSTQSRIRQIANRRLGMDVPDPKSIIIINRQKAELE